ncbi:hypothetical protein BAE44_0011413 [Dichanthelium oligosanthes]|uniref:Leucine-rich repeat-containing N-terminal plant-type domain-containing protein n=1 Tax=Dichanthelium oligosanthes TaxID=888268 RepID=A0A1E5VR16_9POAL|nr:hypothetical protein BAE44_0011413 [Dichanthelium oligosanthes]
MAWAAATAVAAVLAVAAAVLSPASVASASNAEGDALYALRRALADPRGVLQSWDPTLVSPCTWFHVTCNRDSRVTRLDLGNSNLSGSLVPELGHLEHLQYLRLNDNHLTGPVPRELTKISSLKVIDVSNNDLCGTIPTSGPFEHIPLSKLFSDLELPIPADLHFVSSSFEFQGWWSFWKSHLFRLALGPLLQLAESPAPLAYFGEPSKYTPLFPKVVYGRSATTLLKILRNRSTIKSIKKESAQPSIKENLAGIEHVTFEGSSAEDSTRLEPVAVDVPTEDTPGHTEIAGLQDVHHEKILTQSPSDVLLDLDPSVLGLSVETTLSPPPSGPPALADKLQQIKDLLQQPVEAWLRDAHQFRVLFDSICSLLPPELCLPLFSISNLEATKGPFEEAISHIAARKAEEVVRRQIADQYSVLKTQKADLDAITDISSFSSQLDELEVKRQKLLAELNQVESEIKVQQAGQENALAAVHREQEGIKAEFLKLQAMMNQLTLGSDAND